MSRLALQHRVNALVMSVVLLLGCGAVRAGDEEMMNPYQTFDPETGFFVDEPAREHETKPNEEDARREDAAELQTQPPSGEDRYTGYTIAWWIGGLLLLALAGGFIFRGLGTRSRLK